MFRLYFEDSDCVRPLDYTPFLFSLSPQASPCSVPPFSYLLSSPSCSSVSPPNLSRLLLSVFLLPLSDSSPPALPSLSVSLFCHCSGWSPCGTPCRVPNLFIISALCRDARGMLTYTPPRSGYKWAAVPVLSPPAPTAQLTRPLGWTDLTSQPWTRNLKISPTPLKSHSKKRDELTSQTALKCLFCQSKLCTKTLAVTSAQTCLNLM